MNHEKYSKFVFEDLKKIQRSRKSAKSRKSGKSRKLKNSWKTIIWYMRMTYQVHTLKSKLLNLKIWRKSGKNPEKSGNRINFRKINSSYHFWEVNHPFYQEISRIVNVVCTNVFSYCVVDCYMIWALFCNDLE